jgi:hypothetical protein
LTEQERIEALKREARELQDELRPLIARERRGELEFTEEQRAAYCRERLADVRAEAEEIGEARKRRNRERFEREREAREEEQRSLEDQRARTQRENALINRIVNERRSRSFEVGLGGISAGGQPGGSSAVVPLARKVEREVALMFDPQAEDVFGYPAKYIRNLADDEYFGVHLDHQSGELVAGPPLPPSPVPRIEGEEEAPDVA